MANELQQSEGLEAGTYELLRKRILNHSNVLKDKLTLLNEERRNVFGTIETKILATERVTTENNCVPWDMYAFGQTIIFGYNVHLGLRSDVYMQDVFSFYTYDDDHSFSELEASSFLKDKVFLDDFQKLYKYYKHTQFLRFASIGPFFYMVFRVGKDIKDVKTFKWEIRGQEFIYVDNRSDHEYKFPPQHEFQWKRTRREDYRDGLHPHVSIQERVFVECVGGDLTVKVEDNTEDGQGIYSEDVVHKQQTLDDAEFHYAEIGNLIVIKARPYQEEPRYLIFNEKLKEVRRIDAISESCILLPDNHGLIFSNGYYLQSGEYKLFDLDLQDMLFDRRLPSLNGEDYLYVFYNRRHGVYLLLSYNIISQKVENPLVCHGFSIFENGEMCVFRAEEEAKKYHAIQIWRTPFTGPNFQLQEKSNSFLQKIGNKEVVRAMAEMNEIINLVRRDEIYADLYIDVIKKSTDTIDTYHWLGTQQEFELLAPLREIRSVSESAVDEYEKVRKIRESSSERLAELEKEKNHALKQAKASLGNIEAYVRLLAEVRSVRGEVISAKELRYIDQGRLDEFDKELSEAADRISESCVRFLMQDHALQPFEEKIANFQGKLDKAGKVVEIDELLVQGAKIATELDLLIETISNLKITDATQTTSIIEHISEIYGTYNQAKNAISKKRKALLADEGKAEFSATLKLLEQSVSNYLDMCDTPEQCEEYLMKIIVQVEELEGRFSEFDEFITVITEKREEVYNAFESKKLHLAERRGKKANQLYQAAERVLGAIKSKAGTLKAKEDINGYFASDLMVDKVRSISKELVAMGETVKADDVSSKLKTIKEDVLRQLKDKQELFTDGDNIISLGKHKFYTSQLALDISLVVRNGIPTFHLAGTDFYEPVINDRLRELSHLWEQSLLSENDQTYRAEYLAYVLFEQLQSGQVSSIEGYLASSEADQLDLIRKTMNARYQEGYMKGIHEYDTQLILNAVIGLYTHAGVLSYPAKVRAQGIFFWHYCLDKEQKKHYFDQFKAAELLLSVFPASKEFDYLIDELESAVDNATMPYLTSFSRPIARYLFDELTTSAHFTISGQADRILRDFAKYLKNKKAEQPFERSMKELRGIPSATINMIKKWLAAYIGSSDRPEDIEFIDEAAIWLLLDTNEERQVNIANTHQLLEGLKGDHKLIQQGQYALNLTELLRKMEIYMRDTVPLFRELQALKKELSESFKDKLRLNEFKPRVLSSFVRNKLIDQVYFPLIGANLAKQMGTAGDSKRTDLMGLLLLISPPGYGKTTLMEYIASRLGVVFMKINGPAIGHEVRSIDPANAPNAASAEELQKLNLSFEMGNNVMIYLDDIQHCHPEFLQKFISLCDAQRKIEGVYNGKTKTYDFRGKKVCVVMAGNPYTESGDKFQIPDMLANRADIYNLGDVIGDTADVFELSYIENALTSNPVIQSLVSRSQNDVHTLIRMIEKGSAEELDFEVSHSGQELQEYASIMKHMMAVRSVVAKVNQLYIQSAAIADENRTEPPFKLQGSYRDMNKIAEKILPMMNENELQVLIQSHYTGEAQTLTSNAEANLLRFKQLIGHLTTEDEERWKLILEKFAEKQRRAGHGQNALLVDGVAAIAKELKGINRKIDPSPM